MARTLLYASRLPGKLWAEAIEAAVYIKNRLPTKKSEQTPFERLMNRKPMVGHIIEFGTQVHIVKKGKHLDKFEPRTDAGWIVGYTKRRNTYKVYLRERKRVIETCEVIIAPHGKLSQESPGPNKGEQEVLILSQVNERKNSDPEVIPGCMNSTMNEQELELNRQRQLLQSFFEQFRSENGVDISDMIESEPERTIERIQSRELPPIPTNSDQNTNSSHRALFSTSSVKIPETFEEAVIGPLKDEWVQAIKVELKAHEENGTWKVVDKLPEYKTLSAKWVFSIKKNKDGNIERYKARLVARGYNQRKGLDYEETYAPVTGINSIRTLLSICALENLSMTQFDVTTAFLNGLLEEEVYLDHSEGTKNQENKCLKLVKALYGLKQAPRAWYGTLKTRMEEMGFRQLETDLCVFTNSQTRTHVAIYVDD